MSKGDKPLFPREPEIDSEEQRELLESTRERLAASERKSDFEIPDFDKKDSGAQVVLYGPPPFRLDRSDPPAPMYGPPALPFGGGRFSIFLMLVMLFALVVIALAAAGVYFFLIKR